MTTSHSSTSLRTHVDAVLDPMYEQLFAALDLLTVHRTECRPDTPRAIELRDRLQTRLAELDQIDGLEPTHRREIIAAARARWGWWS